MNQNFDLWPRFRFLTKISIFDQNFDLWSRFPFLIKISTFNKYFDIWPKFRILTKISIFDQHFDFWQKFLFLTKNSIFGQTFDFWPRFLFKTIKTEIITTVVYTNVAGNQKSSTGKYQQKRFKKFCIRIWYFRYPIILLVFHVEWQTFD